MAKYDSTTDILMAYMTLYKKDKKEFDKVFKSANDFINNSKKNNKYVAAPFKEMAENLEELKKNIIKATENINNSNLLALYFQKASDCWDNFDTISDKIYEVENDKDMDEDAYSEPEQVKDGLYKLEIEIAPEVKAIEKYLGIRKPASKWIEEIQKEVEKGNKPSPMDIAMILAARQLADSIPGSVSRLEKKILSENELKERAEEIMKQEAFLEFVNPYIYKDNATENVPLDEAKCDYLENSIVTAGHGGELEQLYAESVKKRPDAMELDKKLFGRYQDIEDFKYASYADYLLENKKDYTDKKGVIRIDKNDKELMKKAAAMFVAYNLSLKNEKPNAFRFAKLTDEVLKSGEFRFMKNFHTESLNALLKGDVNDFIRQTQLIMSGADSSENYRELTKEQEKTNFYRAKYSSTVYAALRSGFQLGTTDEEEAAYAYRKLRSDCIDEVKFLGMGRYDYDFSKTIGTYYKQKSNEFVYDNKKILSDVHAESILLQLKGGLEHLEKAAKLGPDVKYANPELAQKLIEKIKTAIAQGENFLNPPEFKDTKKKTAKQQLDEFKLKNGKQFMEATQKYVFEFWKERRAQELKAWDEYKSSKNFPKNLKPLKGIVPDKYNGTYFFTGKEKPAIVNDYLKQRGPKYRRLVSVAKEYMDHISPITEPDPALTMKAIDAAIEYQKGKEKVMSGDDKIRFDNSMRFLASVTCGTHFEKYFDEQIARINKVRGVKPGNKNYITKEQYFDNFQYLKREKDSDCNVMFRKEEKDYEAFDEAFEAYKREVYNNTFADDYTKEKLVDAIKKYQHNRGEHYLQFEKKNYDTTMYAMVKVANDYNEPELLEEQINKYNEEINKHNKMPYGEQLEVLSVKNVVKRAEKFFGEKMENLNANMAANANAKAQAPKK